MAKRPFRSGDKILFKRDTEYGREWEPGVYKEADPDPQVRGWHIVFDATGYERHYIPTRRIKHQEELVTRTHKWVNDKCVNCDLRRDGCSAGHTGSMKYTTPDGAVRYRAGPCEPRKP